MAYSHFPFGHTGGERLVEDSSVLGEVTQLVAEFLAALHGLVLSLLVKRLDLEELVVEQVEKGLLVGLQALVQLVKGACCARLEARGWELERVCASG